MDGEWSIGKYFGTYQKKQKPERSCRRQAGKQGWEDLLADEEMYDEWSMLKIEC
jgi:hypothetical protein